MATVASKKDVPEVKTPVVKKAVVKKVVPAVKKSAPVKPAVKAVKPASPAAKPLPLKNLPENSEKAKKAKLVRDSFTMPEAEYEVLSQVKKACLKAGVEVKKSQLLRIGLVLLSKTDVPALKKLISGLAPLKAGRPKKEK